MDQYFQEKHCKDLSPSWTESYFSQEDHYLGNLENGGSAQGGLL